jgi:hypothetical protein
MKTSKTGSRVGSLSLAMSALLCAAAFAATPYEVYNSPKRVNSLVYEAPTYHHAATVAAFRGKVYVAWNGNLYSSKEGDPGQVIMLRSSDDGGLHWSDTVIPFVHEYRALDEKSGKAVDAQPGNADDDRKIPLVSAREWQPALIVFHDRLLMFWGQDRNAPGSSLMMSELESDGGQWRSHEMRFKSDGTPYLVPVMHGGRDLADLADSPLVSFGGPGSAKIVGAEAYQGLAGLKLLPAPHQVAVVKGPKGEQVLAVASILEETSGDWANHAVKIPAVFTTTDLVHWSMSVVPLRQGERDFLASAAPNASLLSAWEPNVFQDAAGNLELLFRINLAPRANPAAAVPGNGFRVAEAHGRWSGSTAVEWSAPRVLDYDMPVSRSSVVYAPASHRWVLVQDHAVQGGSYEAGGRLAFNTEKYEPWARENMTAFFSLRGEDDFLSGLNLSSKTEEQGVELVHYPYAAMDGDELLVAYSSHRREPSCKGEKVAAAPMASCHDAIHFTRVRELPDPNRLYVYPNHFARYFAYGASRPQEKTYGFDGTVLTLIGRGSAGIETPGDAGCIHMRFKVEGDMPGEAARPLISFGRTPDRLAAVGVGVARQGPGYVLTVNGRRASDQELRAGQWADETVCYNYTAHSIAVDGRDFALGNAMNRHSYLGDPSLAKASEAHWPNIAFDLSQTRWTRNRAE